MGKRLREFVKKRGPQVVHKSTLNREKEREQGRQESTDEAAQAPGPGEVLRETLGDVPQEVLEVSQDAAVVGSPETINKRRTKLSAQLGLRL